MNLTNFVAVPANRGMTEDAACVLTGVGPRLRALRRERGMTLAQLSETTGISLSTLSRLEAGQRKPTLELLLPLAKAHGVQLDELVGVLASGVLRVLLCSFKRHGTTFVLLTNQLGALRAYKQILPGGAVEGPVEQRVHEGYEWLYVLSGRLRLVLGENDIVQVPGEASAFTIACGTQKTNTTTTPKEFLSLFGPQGERLH